MKYIQPYDQPTDPNAAYADLDAVHGVDGSIPPAKFFNAVQAEILNVIKGAGLTPNDGDLTQLQQAIAHMIPTVSGPNDASLVHYASDGGVAGAISLTPSIAMASLPAGAILLFYPAANSPAGGNVTVTVAAAAQTHPIKRDDGAAPMTGDIIAGRLLFVQYDGAVFRILNCQRAVVVDGATITGSGLPGAPLAANIQDPWTTTAVGALVSVMWGGGMANPPTLGASFAWSDIVAGSTGTEIYPAGGSNWDDFRRAAFPNNSTWRVERFAANAWTTVYNQGFGMAHLRRVA